MVVGMKMVSTCCKADIDNCTDKECRYLYCDVCSRCGKHPVGAEPVQEAEEKIVGHNVVWTPDDTNNDNLPRVEHQTCRVCGNWLDDDGYCIRDEDHLQRRTLAEVLAAFFKTDIDIKEAQQQIKEMVIQAQIDELGHVQLDHGNYITQTFVNGRAMTIENRILQLKDLMKR